MTSARAAVQKLVPDEPAWVEARAMALDDDAWAAPAGVGGWVVGSDTARLMVAIGAADPVVIVEALKARTGWTMLAATAREDLVAAARAVGRVAARALIHTLADADALPPSDGASLLGKDDDISHLAPALVEELTSARDRGRPVYTARVDGVPASFAYAPWRSERWFDVSVDTAPGYRQLGLATVVASAMIRGERALGREAVWGADEDNDGSLRLAARLGFQRVADLWVIA